uniref:non-specific serine/threonine protein kinase n=1 Tax=Aegilops tauschii TaxID=37682 RepID=M8BSK9_AEGTA
MENESQLASATPRDFTFQLLKQITNDFSEDNRIGVGGYGVVYKGTLDNGEVIAVKKLYYKHPGLDSDKQFQNECTNLMRVHHQNIVRNMMPKIGDFGLSRLFDSTETCSTKGIIGTPGYMPPEYINRFHITPKFDVFSLGVTIIKIMSGQEGYSKFADMSSQEFIQLVHENWEKALQTTVLAHTSHGVKKCIEIALRCVEADRVKRPTIAEVVDELSKIDTTIIDELNKIDTDRSSPIEQTCPRSSATAAMPNLVCTESVIPLSSCHSSSTQVTNLQCNQAFTPCVNSDDGQNMITMDLRLATRKFHSNCVLGEGGFGCVYKGWIDENTLSPCEPGTGIPVAVKRLGQESSQGHKEWLAEINLAHLSHPNLVKLFGYCLEDEHRLLVYEFIPHGSLDNHLFKRDSCQPLSWNLRMKVALGVAKALAYLHCAEINVIVRDVKNSNILLDRDYTAKLSDFGVAVNGPVDQESHLSTAVKGTRGYAAPEYIATGLLTQKCDIYGFGVLLLELLSGRRALDENRPGMEQNLVDWARPYLRHKHKIRCVIDTSLGGLYSFSAVQKLAALALECLCTDPKKRPAMDSVVSILEGVQEDEELEAAEHQESGKKVTASASRKNGKSRWNIFGGGRS